jgi:hypothetical protein
MNKTKVVIFGKTDAGKSSLIQSLVPGALNVEYGGSTVAMDYGKIVFRGHEFHLFGTPGQAHLNPVRECLTEGIDVAVFVMDNSRLFDREDIGLLKELEALKVPYLIFVNHKPEVKSERRRIDRLLENFTKPLEVIEGSAKTGDGLSELLLALESIVNKSKCE